MKRSSVIMLLALIINCLSAQNTSAQKNAVSLEFYQPIQITTPTYYYNDNMTFAPSGFTDEIKRRYFSNAIGLSYERELKPGLILRPRAGVTIRKLDESRIVFSEGVATNSTLEETYSYRQKHLNFFLGLSRRIEVARNFTIDFGFDLMTALYLPTTDRFTSLATINTQYPDSAWTTEYISITSWGVYGNMLIAGIGPSFKPEFCFSNNLFVSAEMQIYFTFSKVKHQLVSTAISNYYTTPLEATADMDQQQWGWTKMSPLIRVGYKF